MSTSDIAKVYQFLATQSDWVTAADANGDGTVIKSEFRTYMEENYEWDGTPTDSEKNDLINSFWNSIDTDQSGKISGTNLKDKNALNSSEIDAMQEKIEMYEILNDFTSSLKAPSVVSDTTGWKKSVSEELATLVEKYIENGGTADELEAYLEEEATAIEQKTTADYCASEYLQSVMSDFVKEYGYAYEDDSTLQGMIDTYIQNIPEDVTFAEIRETVINIIDAYLATAGLKEDNAFDLSEYGYTVSDNSSLNDLQKSVIQKNLENALADIQNEDDYSTYSTLYDTAVSDYISEVLSNAKFSDFETLQNYGMTEFKASDIYLTLEKTIQTKKLFTSDELTEALAEGISETFAERFGYIMSGEIDAYDSLMEEALSKVQNGDFDTESGELDTEALIAWIVSQARTNLADFYPNGYSDMGLVDLNITYDILIEQAVEQQDASKVKEAAIAYCEALSAKSTLLAQAVIDIFGSDYESTINSMLSGEVRTKMEELKEMALEIGDISTFTISSWNDLPTEVSLATGASKNYQLNTIVMSGDTQISADRISYSATVKSGDGTATVSNNTLTISGSTSGYTTVVVSTIVDGTVLDTQTITIHVVDSSFDWASMTTSYNGYINMNGTSSTPNDVKTLGELYSGNGVISLLDTTSLSGAGKENCIAQAQSNIASFVEFLAAACEATGNYDSTALNTAKQKVIELYQTALSHSLDNWPNRKTTNENIVSYDGENYNYTTRSYCSDNTTNDTADAHSSSASSNDLGLQINYGHCSGNTQIVVNTTCVMDLFNKFYAQALS